MAQNVLDGPCVPAARRRGHRTVRRGSTARTHRLATDAVTRVYRRFAEHEALDAAARAPHGLSPMLAQAHRFAQVHPRMTPVIRDDELIVGARLRAPDGDALQGWRPDGDAAYVDGMARNAPADRPDIQAMARRGLLSPSSAFNHKVVDYANFIRTGSVALADRARRLAKRRRGDRREFALAFAMGHDAMVEHACTYAHAARRLADTATPRRAAELREIARICDTVPARPADTFHEALQSLWFAYMVAADATGRIDVYLNDFYQADLAAARITPDRALELVECFLIKLHGDHVAGVSNVSSIQTMTLGGLLADGSDATNDLTRLFLEAARRVRLLRPTIYVRCHDHTPPDVIDLAVTMLGEGLAEPNFYGDRPIIEGLVRAGIPEPVARDYALSGCTEVVSPGRGNWGGVNGWLNLPMAVDDALRDVARDEHADAQRMWRTIEQHVDRLAEACRVNTRWLDDHAGPYYYNPSLLMPVCLDRCQDVGHGGAETHLGQWEAIGLPNAADMIYTAERLAFAEERSLADVFRRLDAGDAQLLGQIRRLPKFGNDHAEVDAIAARLVRLTSDALERRHTPRRTSLTLGHLAGGENMHIAYGQVMGPTLDGRTRGQTLADSLAGSHGVTRAGPTALVRSLCRLDHSRLVAGNITTLRLSPADFATPRARANVAALVRSFVAMGGSQLQINVLDAPTLRRAQQHPHEHAGLMVRVAGYSADFTGLGRCLQDEIIARTEGLA